MKEELNRANFAEIRHAVSWRDGKFSARMYFIPSLDPAISLFLCGLESGEKQQKASF
jgi:hypothetical protein